MNRRNFSKNVLSAGFALSASTNLLNNPNRASINDMNILIHPTRILPQKLKPGDTIGMIAPASSFPSSRIQKTEENMKMLGLKIKWGKNINHKYGYLAGKDDARISDLHDMFADTEIKAIWCIRGGYGCTRIIENLDYELIKNNPKILIGYSDVTALLISIYYRTGLVGFHGPVGSSTFSDYTKTHVENILFGKEKNSLIYQSSNNTSSSRPGFESFTISKGSAIGQLMGGNLSLLAAMCGTGFQMDLAGKLLFIEDIEEKPYRIDRMLTQLRSTYDLTKCAGIVCGIFEDCQPDKDDRSLTLKETLQDRLGDLGIPVGYGYSFGHITDQCTFPIGIEAEMNADNMTLRLMEDWVQD